MDATVQSTLRVNIKQFQVIVYPWTTVDGNGLQKDAVTAPSLLSSLRKGS